MDNGIHRVVDVAICLCGRIERRKRRAKATRMVKQIYKVISTLGISLWVLLYCHFGIVGRELTRQ